MIFRSGPRSPVAAALLSVAVACADAPSPPVATARPGAPLEGLDDRARGRFLLGRALFERLATPEEGLGPLFNAERCSACHDEPTSGGSGHRIPVLKATRFEDGRCDPLEAEGGDNVQRLATPLLRAAGFAEEAVPRRANATERVIAPPLFGLGLLEAVSEDALLTWADPDDTDRDGVSGRLARRPDGAAARFGRKGDAVSVADFVDQALRFELGFTTEGHTREVGPGGRPLPPGVDPMPDPEMDGPTAALLTDYVRYLAPPAPEEPATPAVADSLAAGRQIFEAIGCAACHRPSLETGEVDDPALGARRIEPWTDLLLHDLGSGDGHVCTPAATPGEYRTAPLWGLRHRGRLLHDGRATSVVQAVLAHGGEATGAVGRFHALSAADRARLLRFLASL